MKNTIEFVYGDESFLVEDFLKKFLKTHESASIEWFNEDFEMDDLMRSLTTVDMFASSKAIVVKNPGFLFKKLEKPDVQKLDALFEAAETGGHAMLIVNLGKKMDGRKKGPTVVKKRCKATEFKPFKDWEEDKVQAWIQSHVRSLGKSIQRDAVSALVEVGGVNLRILANEIEKVLIYMGETDEITLDHVHSVTGGATSTIFKFNDAMRDRNQTEMMKTMTTLFNQGGEPIKLMGMIVANLRMYTQLVSMTAERKSVDAIGKKIGKNPYFLKRLIGPIQRNYPLADLKKAYAKIAETDFSIKTGKLKPRIALELAVLAITSRT